MRSKEEVNRGEGERGSGVRVFFVQFFCLISEGRVSERKGKGWEK